jgi:hypothetical protein
VGGNEKSRDYYIPTLHYARCVSAVIALWRTAHYHSNLLVASFYAALSPTDLASVHVGHDLGDQLALITLFAAASSITRAPFSSVTGKVAGVPGSAYRRGEIARGLRY